MHKAKLKFSGTIVAVKVQYPNSLDIMLQASSCLCYLYCPQNWFQPTGVTLSEGADKVLTSIAYILLLVVSVDCNVAYRNHSALSL